MGLGGRRRLGQEKASWTAGVSDSGSRFGLPPGGSLPGFLGGPLRNMLVWSPLIVGDRNHPVPRHGSPGGEGPQGARAGPRAREGGAGVGRWGDLIPL